MTIGKLVLLTKINVTNDSLIISLGSYCSLHVSMKIKIETNLHTTYLKTHDDTEEEILSI